MRGEMRQVSDVLGQARRVAEREAPPQDQVVAELRQLVRELAHALDGWADSKDDPDLHALLARAREAGGGR